jgi:flagellar assembly protein FliH
LGRVVKGAQIAQQAYQIRPPAAQPPRLDAFRTESHREVANDPELVEGQPQQEHIDFDAVHVQAARLLADASTEADSVVADARAHALKLIDDAERGVADIEKSAKELGFNQGLADGRAAAQAEMDEMLATMRGLVDMARVERHKIIETAEPEIVRLSVTIAERILHDQVAQQPETVVNMVRSAITRLVNRETVTVRVNPADIAVMREHRDNLMALNDIDNMRVIEDQRVDRGGVVIETDAGTIDAKVSTQLREVRRLLAVEDPITVAPSSELAIINPPAQAS